MNRLIRLVALLSVLMASLIPGGYMVASAKDGSLTVRMCNTGDTSQRQVSRVDPDYETYLLLYGEVPETDADPVDEPCDMGPSPLGKLDSALILPAALIGDAPVQGLGRKVLTGIFPAALPPSTGPPAT
ncbi:hypothetical protein [Pontixanthobacter luteolus]|uniref:hypothetical protein n=1 Tax=Pontixanthobacter luteolus TaxID=295089 RepID=UPI002302A57E|nr:hypothetical protein [Pontixanthobacter luteolus]